MKLLEMKLFNLPSEHVPAVIGEVLKAEYMLVWAYHDADNVREFAIRVSGIPEQHHMTVLLNSFYLNGHTLGFYPKN